MEAPPLRYLAAADVERAMPPLAERLELAALTMTALVDDAQLPPKIGVYPGPLDAFSHAMPAWMRGRDGGSDLLGMKWVTGFPTNAPLGMPSIHGTVLLSDAQTGVPRAIVDAGPITAHRTAAVSGVALRRWGPAIDGAARVAVLGAGVQARSHLPVIAHLLDRPADLILCDRDEDRLEVLADDVRAGGEATGSYASVATTTSLSEAVAGADLIVSMLSFGPERQVLAENEFATHATIVAVDYDMVVPASVAHGAGLFVTDDRGQYLANRTDKVFADYPDPGATIGEAMRDAAPRPAGRVLVSHLGVGLADVVFSDAILRAAEASELGTVLER